MSLIIIMMVNIKFHSYWLPCLHYYYNTSICACLTSSFGNDHVYELYWYFEKTPCLFLKSYMFLALIGKYFQGNSCVEAN